MNNDDDRSISDPRCPIQIRRLFYLSYFMFFAMRTCKELEKKNSMVKRRKNIALFLIPQL